MPRTVIVSGCSGSGKTFTGDYLQMMCGFKHVDADTFMVSKLPEHVAMTADFMMAFGYWFEENPAPIDLWHPYFEAVIGLVNSSQNNHDDVVLSWSVYNREARDYLRQRLPGVIFVLLTMDADELVKRHITRFKAYAEAQGKSISEAFEAYHKKPYTMEAFVESTKAILRGLQPIAPDEPFSHTINIDANGFPFKELSRILRLPPPQEPIPIDQIANVNYTRFASRT